LNALPHFITEIDGLDIHRTGLDTLASSGSCHRGKATAFRRNRGLLPLPAGLHFIHVRSKHENALPLIVTHGWPGSIIEQMKIIDPLTNPTAHGASAWDAFHLVIPSMPGYGFSGKTDYP
jgi:pimeloyl-ACP methyl ester carboxylesterase